MPQLLPCMVLWVLSLWLTGLVISCSFSLCIWAYTVLPGRFLLVRDTAQFLMSPWPQGPCGAWYRQCHSRLFPGEPTLQLAPSTQFCCPLLATYSHLPFLYLA